MLLEIDRLLRDACNPSTLELGHRFNPSIRDLKHMINPTALIGALALFGAISLSADHHATSPRFAGEWLATGDLPDGQQSKTTMTIDKTDGKLVAVSTNENGEETKMDRVKVDGKKITLEVDMESDGQFGTIGASASLNDKGELVGTWYLKGSDGTDYGTADWNAVRSSSSLLAGTWNGVGKSDEGDDNHKAVFKKSGGAFQGNISSDEGGIDLEDLKVSANVVSFKLPYLGGTLKIKASPRSATKLVGKWTFFDASESELATGDWIATKAK